MRKERGRDKGEDRTREAAEGVNASNLFISPSLFFYFTVKSITVTIFVLFFFLGRVRSKCNGTLGVDEPTCRYIAC